MHTPIFCIFMSSKICLQIGLALYNTVIYVSRLPNLRFLIIGYFYIRQFFEKTLAHGIPWWNFLQPKPKKEFQESRQNLSGHNLRPKLGYPGLLSEIDFLGHHGIRNPVGIQSPDFLQHIRLFARHTKLHKTQICIFY